MAISTNGTIITRLAGALYGEYLSNASYTELNTTTASTVAANMLSNDFAGKTDAQIATTVLTNLSLNTVAGLNNWVAAQLTAAGSTAAAKGAKLVSMLNDYAMMTDDATYGAGATSFNSKVAASLVLSQTTGNAGGSFATAGSSAVAATFTLTTGTDSADNVSAARGSLISNFRFSENNETVTGAVGTLSANDVLVDGSTTDEDVLTVSLNGASGAFTAANIETINVTFSAGSANLELDNVSGAETVNVTGAVAGSVDGFNAAEVQPTINVNNITKVVTITTTALAGTTTAGNPDKINVGVSGLTYGTTTATRSGITLTSGAAGTLETLNIASTGTAANDFALDAGTNVTLGTVAFSGDTSVTARVATTDVDSVIISGAMTGSAVATVRIDNNSTSASASINAANFSGVTISVEDSTVGSDEASISSLKDATKVVLLTDFDVTDFSVQGATYAALAASFDLTLDNKTAETDLDVANINMENVKALTVHSLGYATSGSTTAENDIGILDGDFTTITIDGDTSFAVNLDIDPVQTATSTTTARTVTVTAAGMTGSAFVDLDAVTNGTDTKVTYVLTGTANNDILKANTTGNTLNGGAGNDSITSNIGADVITGGDGNDLIVVSGGADLITGGAGNDTYDINGKDVSAVAQVETLTLVTTGAVYLAGETITLTIDSVAHTYTLTNADVAGIASTDDLVMINQSLANFINQTQSAVGAAISSGTILMTAKTAGTSFTVTTADTSSDTDSALGVGASSTTANVVAVDVNTSISDFAAGDILDLAGLSVAATYFEGATADAADAANGLIVLTGEAYASNNLAENAVDDGGTDNAIAVIVYLDSSLGYAVGIYDGDIGADGTPVEILKFTGITTLTQLAAAFSAASFVG